MNPADADPVSYRNHGNRGECKDQCNHRRRNIQRLVDVRRRQIFFKNELDPVGQGLKQTKRSDARGSPPILDMPDDFPFEPNRVSYRRKQYPNREYDLNDRDEYEGLKAQPNDFLNSVCCSRRRDACETAAEDGGATGSVSSYFTVCWLGMMILDHRVQCLRIETKSAGTEQIIIRRHNERRILLGAGSTLRNTGRLILASK